MSLGHGILEAAAYVVDTEMTSRMRVNHAKKRSSGSAQLVATLISY